VRVSAPKSVIFSPASAVMTPMLIHLRSVVPTPRTGSSRHSRMNLTMALPNATSLRKGRQIQQLTVGGSENPLGAGSSRRGTSRRCASYPFFQLPRSFFLTVIGNSCVAMTRASKGAGNLLPFKHTVRDFVGRCRHLPAQRPGLFVRLERLPAGTRTRWKAPHFSRRTPKRTSAAYTRRALLVG
jgi:hypothetical protein